MAKCNPTRSTLLTGTFMGGKQCQSLGELIGWTGYATLYVGKEHFDEWIRIKKSSCVVFHRNPGSLLKDML